ncbi:DUF4174 domain-containing protein [Bradyrhizobium oligotrophicum]|uniref:DUF4174 domain-containing protein n=1 Tax=Bradyrhizobium oligotrophicum TaxID=44255 RepID=UPI003EBFBCA9
MRRPLLTTAIRLGAIALLGAITLPTPSSASPLALYRWTHRILVVTGPDDAAAQQQRRIFHAAKAGMSERQIILREAVDDSALSRELRSALGTDGRRFKVTLIGKDGHAALASETPISADDLFKRVDAMPMRQDEMRRARSEKSR